MAIRIYIYISLSDLRWSHIGKKGQKNQKKLSLDNFSEFSKILKISRILEINFQNILEISEKNTFPKSEKISIFWEIQKNYQGIFFFEFFDLFCLYGTTFDIFFSEISKILKINFKIREIFNILENSEKLSRHIFFRIF